MWDVVDKVAPEVILGVLILWIFSKTLIAVIGKLIQKPSPVAEKPMCAQDVKPVLNAFEKRLARVEKMIEDLHAWHNQKDADGIFLWYVRRSFEHSISKLSDVIEQETRVLEKLINRIED